MHGPLNSAVVGLMAAATAVLPLLHLPGASALPTWEDTHEPIQISMLGAFEGRGYLIPHHGHTPIGCINSSGIWVNDGKPCDAFSWLPSHDGGYALVNTAGEYCRLSDEERAFVCSGWDPVLSKARHGRLLGDDDNNLFNCGDAPIPDTDGSRVLYSGIQENSLHVTLAWQRI